MLVQNMNEPNRSEGTKSEIPNEFKRFLRNSEYLTVFSVQSAYLSVVDVNGRPERESSSISHYTANLLNYLSKTWVSDNHSLPVNMFQQSMGYCSGLAKFHQEFSIDKLIF